MALGYRLDCKAGCRFCFQAKQKLQRAAEKVCEEVEQLMARDLEAGVNATVIEVCARNMT
jgi:hypothetical protein